MKDWYSATELAAQHLPGLPGTQQGINKLAERAAWMRRRAAGSAQAWEYPLSALPKDARLAVIRAHYKALAESGGAIGRQEALREALKDRAAAECAEAGMASYAGMPGKAQARADARATLVTACRDYCRAGGLPGKRGREAFAIEYNAGTVPVEADVRALIPRTCANSLKNWEKALETGGLGRLAGNYGHRKGKGVIDTDPEINAFVLGMLVEYPHADATRVRDGLQARFKDRELPSLRRVQDWLKIFRDENRQLVLRVTNPDAHRSKFGSAAGNAAATITALNQRWELDGTKGDILLTDKARHTLVFGIDVYARRMKIRVSRTATADSVCALLRACLTDWGVPAQIGTDNGSDYVSKRVKAAIAGLDIEHDIAPPFTPQHKPFVERGIQTFLHDLLELMEGYIGHNVAERKDIEARKSFAERLTRGSDRPVDLRMSPEELQRFCDDWCTGYETLPHAGLKGKTPFQMVAGWTQPIRTISDRRALDVLLAPAPGGDGTRVVGKDGIRLDNGSFVAGELGGLIGQTVRVLLDEADIGRIYVFRLDGPFVCVAECPELSGSGISRAELAGKQNAGQKAVLSEGKKHLRAAAKKAKVKDVAQEILADRLEAAGKLVRLPGATTDHVTAALEEAARAARARSGAAPVASPVSPAEAAKLAALEAELSAPQAPAEVVRLDTKATRFLRALDLEARVDAGHALDEADTRWLKGYQASPEYQMAKKTSKDFGVERVLESLRA